MEKNLEEITEETIQLISHTLEALNKTYGLNVKIRYKEKTLLPEIDRYHQIIRFNRQFLPWLALWQIRNFTLTSDYYVAYKSFAYKYYAKAENKLSIIESNLQKLIEKNTNIKNESHNPVISYDQLLKYQVLFSIFHEYAHLLFSRDEKIREEKVGTLKTEILSNINKKRSLRTVYNQLIQEHLKGTPWLYNTFCKLIWFPIVVLRTHSISNKQNELYQDEKKVEEIACDIWAFEKLISILDFTGYSLEKPSEILTHITKVMYYLDITYCNASAQLGKKRQS